MIAVTVDVRCAWCNHMVATTATGISHSLTPLDQAQAAADRLVATHRERGALHVVDDEHVCDSCFRRGRPAPVVPPTPKRTRKAAA